MQSSRLQIPLAVLAVLALCSRTTHVAADIIPPGSAGVSHQILIEGLTAFPDYTFVLYPTHVGEHAARVSRILTPGEPVNFYKFSTPRVYAFDGNLTSVDDLTSASFEDPGLPRSELALQLISSVPERDPTRKVHTTYRIAAIDGSNVVLTMVGELRFDEQGNPVGPAAISKVSMISMVAVAAIGAALLVLIVHRRRRSIAQG